MGTIGNNCISAAAESQFPENDPQNRTARRDVLRPGTAMDLTRGAAGFGDSSGGRPKVPLFYRRLIVINLAHPICKLTGKQRLVRELP
jgi:hypothetical protein